jgi:hypothetical protein
MLHLSTSPCDSAQAGTCACLLKLPSSSMATKLRAANGRAQHLARLSVTYHDATAARCQLPAIELPEGT